MTRPQSSDAAQGSAPNAQWLAYPNAQSPSEQAAVLPPALNPLLEVKASVQVCVGSATMSVRELTSTRMGQVIALDRMVDGVVDLLVEGKTVARGQLVAVDDHFAIRLTELPAPLAA